MAINLLIQHVFNQNILKKWWDIKFRPHNVIRSHNVENKLTCVLTIRFMQEHTQTQTQTHRHYIYIVSVCLCLCLCVFLHEPNCEDTRKFVFYIVGTNYIVGTKFYVPPLFQYILVKNMLNQQINGQSKMSSGLVY